MVVTNDGEAIQEMAGRVLYSPILHRENLNNAVYDIAAGQLFRTDHGRNIAVPDGTTVKESLYAL
jgi:hypothetical protein